MEKNAALKRMIPELLSTSIEQLIEYHLVQIAQRAGGWTILYQDPEDLTYWELTYPRGDTGSRPLLLTQLSAEQVRDKYDFLDD